MKDKLLLYYHFLEKYLGSLFSNLIDKNNGPMFDNAI